jgi:hypothetical protein
VDQKLRLFFVRIRRALLFTHSAFRISTTKTSNRAKFNIVMNHVLVSIIVHEVIRCYHEMED